jgi:Fe-S-cluster containining protein
MNQKINPLENENGPVSALSEDGRKALEEIYRRVDEEVEHSGVKCWLRGDCCDFEKTDHTLYASSVELAYLKEKHPEPFKADSVLCPFWEEGLCVERERRPLGCRTYFCDGNYSQQLQAIYEKYHAEIKELAQSGKIPYSYEPFVAALRTRHDDS